MVVSGMPRSPITPSLTGGRGLKLKVSCITTRIRMITPSLTGGTILPVVWYNVRMVGKLLALIGGAFIDE